MFLNSIDRKPLLINSDGEQIRDLTQSMFDFQSNDYVNFQAYRVPSDYEMRIDLISQSVYNNTLYSEFILKYNGISNPFTISNGDVILIPNLDSAKKNVKQKTDQVDSAESRIRDSYKYLDPTKAPKKDPQISSFDGRNLDESSDKKLKEGALPPNIAEEGAQQITYRNGRVYFGESIGESSCLKNGMSSSEFLTTIIKRKTI